MFLGEAIGPFDHIRQFAPWNGPKPKDAWDVLQADGVLQFYVWRDLVFEAWRNGQVPFWNPYELAGTPLMANSQSAALYPPHILMGILHVPTALAITLLAWFHLFWAGLGTSKLVRALGGTEVGGVVAGASFALSPFMLSWTALSSVITTVCWIPWLLFMVCRIRTRNPMRQFSSELDKVEVDDQDARTKVAQSFQTKPFYRYKEIGFLGLVIALLFLGGHLQFAAYGVGAMLLFVLFEWTVELKDRKSIISPSGMELGGVVQRVSVLNDGLSVLIACCLGFAIAAPQLLPVLKHSADSHRRNVASEAGYESYIASAIKPFEFANLVTTKALGDPRSAVEVGNGLSVAEYWPPMAKPGANFAESAVTIGPLVLGLLFLVPWRERRTWPMAAIGVLALLLAMGTILNKALYFGLPGWSSTGSPGRIIVLFVMAACVLAGLAVPKGAVEKRRFGSAVLGIVVTSILATLLFPSIAPGWQQGVDQLGTALQRESNVSGLDWVIKAMLIGIPVLFFTWHKELVKFRAFLAPFVLLVGISGLTSTFIPTGKPLESLETTRSKDLYPVDRFNRIAFINDNWGLIAADPSALMPPNTAAISRWHDLAGYDSLLNKGTKTLLDEVNGADSAPPANGNMMFVKSSFDPKKLAEAGVREAWSRKPLEGLGEPLAQEDGYYRYRVPGLGRLSIEGGQCKPISETLNQIKAQVQGPGRLVLRDRNLPGWLPKVDGKHVPLVGTTWLEIDIPAGDHEVEFNYVAPGFMTGVYLAFPAWLLIFGSLCLGLRKPRNPAEVD